MTEKNILVGQRVAIPSKETCGTVAYTGTTLFSHGKWIGVVLDEKKGKNNGIVQDQSYFQCDDGYGIFLRQTQVTLLGEDDEGTIDFTKTEGATPLHDRPKSRLPLGSVGKGGSRSQREDLTPKMVREEVSLKDTSQTESKRSSIAEVMSFGEAKSLASTPVGTAPTHEAHVRGIEADLKAQIKDLNEKLETLTIKRGQDKDKLKEADKIKLQLAQLNEFKARIMESQANLQKELSLSRDETRAARESHESYVEETSELSENVEMLTLDREMAEEKAEALQAEVEALNEKVEELTLDLEIVRAEAAEMSEAAMAGGREGGSEGAPIHLKQLETQNAKLRETLVRMRDISAQDKHELQKKQKEVEALQNEGKDAGKALVTTQEQIKALEETIADLQEQVDAALGAEEMVESLTEQNLQLEARVEEFNEVVTDLEEINDTNDQLAETARETELELRQEVDIARGRISQIERERDANGELIADQKATILKFRDLVRNLHDTQAQLRRTLAQKEGSEMAEVQPEPSLMEFKKMFTEAKAQSKAIELELRQLQVEQATDHVKLISLYLPECFTQRGGDHESVLLCLLCSRLRRKCGIVSVALRERCGPQPHNITKQCVVSGHDTQQFAFNNKMIHMLNVIQSTMTQMGFVLDSCSVDTFLRLGITLPEINAQEHTLDFYIDLLKKDQLDETVVTDLLERSTLFSLNTFSAHLGDERLDRAQYLLDAASAASAAGDAIAVYAEMVLALLEPSSPSDDVRSLLSAVRHNASETSDAARRIRRRIPRDGSAGPLVGLGDTKQAIWSATGDLFAVIRVMAALARAVTSQPDITAESGCISCLKASELAHEAADSIFGSADDGGFESVRGASAAALTALTTAAHTLEKGEFDFDGTHDKQTVAPIRLRANRLKEEVSATDILKERLTSREEDIRDLRKSLKSLADDLSHMSVRREMAEKKFTTAVRDADVNSERLQRKLDDALITLRRKEKEYNVTLDHLQLDIEQLVQEKDQFRDKMQTLKKSEGRPTTPVVTTGPNTTVLPPSLPTPASVTARSSNAMPTAEAMEAADSYFLRKELIKLKEQLRFSERRRAELIRSDLLDQLRKLKPLPSPEEDEVFKRRQAKICEFRKRQNRLYIECERYFISLIDIRPDPKLPPRKVQLARLQEKCIKMAYEKHLLQASFVTGGIVKADFGDYVSPQYNRMMKERGAKQSCKMPVTHDDFDEFHDELQKF